MSRSPTLPETLRAEFEPLAILGEGASGMVCAAIQRRLRRRVALKLLHGRPEDPPEERARFEKEARLLASLAHPAIPEVYDYGVVEDRPYLVFELVDGESLSARIEREGALPVEEVLEMGITLAEVLAFLHSRGIWHRDIKPANLVADMSGALHLLDFGLALRQSDRTRLTQAGAVVGTVTYMDPRIFSEEGYGAATDLYALSATLYRAVCGRPPHGGATLEEHLNLKLAGPPVGPTTIRPEIPLSLDRLLVRMLQPEVALRLPDAESFGRALESIRSGGRGAATRGTELLPADGPGPAATRRTVDEDSPVTDGAPGGVGLIMPGRTRRRLGSSSDPWPWCSSPSGPDRCLPTPRGRRGRRLAPSAGR